MFERHKNIIIGIGIWVGITTGILSGGAAHAQLLLDPALVPNPYSQLKTLSGYQPSVLASEAIAKDLYDHMPVTDFTGHSECFQRAEVWTYRFDQMQNIHSMKVFLFFTHRYQSEFDYVWDYHVAPLIPVKMTDGTIEELVFDPTFTHEGKPISINKWTHYFILPDVECPLIENYQDFLDNQERYYCYLMKSPMYNYIPDNFIDDADPKGTSGAKGSNWFDPKTQVRTGWRPGDLLQMKKGLDQK